MRDLADAVMLSRSGLTRLVDRMAEAGLVTRKPDPGDRRGTLACISTKGTTTLRRAAPIHLRGIQEHFGSVVEDDEVAVLQRALGRVVSGRPRRRDRR
jgi:DNA-binding MarR family transcriptional regulator